MRAREMGQPARVGIGFLVLAALCAPAAAQDAAARSWNQARGNAERTGAADVEPIRADPAEVWKHKLPGPVHGEPVAWGGVVYVAAGKSSRRELFAFDATTGEQLAKRALGTGPTVHIAVHEGVVIVNDGAQLLGLPHKDKGFTTGWKLPGAWRGAPCVHDGKVLAADGKLHVIDARTGKSAGGGGSANGSVAVYRTEAGLPSVAVVVEVAGTPTELQLRRADLGPDWRAPAGSTQTIGKPAATPSFTLPALFRVSADGPTWFVASDGAIRDKSPSAFLDGSTVRGNAISMPAAVRGGVVFGFDAKGSLLGATGDVRSRPVIGSGRLPDGARPGAASIAKGVVCFGNWALEIDTRRVLWCVSEMKPVTPVVPVSDGRAVYVTDADELVGIADPALTGGSGDGSGPRARGFSRPEGPRPKPGADDGVLLATGEIVDGSVDDLEDGRVRFTPKGGTPRELPVEDVAVFVKGGKVVWSGEENALLQLWREHVRADAAVELEKLVRRAAGDKLVAEGRRVLADLERVGISEKTRTELEKLFAGMQESSSAGKLAKFHEVEAKARKALFAKVLEGVKWCEDHKQNGAAAALLADCEIMLPGSDVIETRGKELIPPGFPFAEEKDAGRLWVEWADQIVPAGARFLAPDDRAWARVEGPLFAPGNCLAFRTKNLLLFASEKDMEVIGSCLRNAEGAVRALQRLLNGGEPDAVIADTDRMQVRIFETREQYLEVGKAPKWSAGAYSPSEGVSRFYVPRMGENKEPMGRSLFDTMSHELTHHYVHTRFMGNRMGRSIDTPGFWIVEGIASFMGDQAIEMGRRGPALDDATASSIDAAAQAYKKGKLIPMKRYLLLTQYDFGRLKDKPLVVVHLRHTIQGRILDERGLFYEQAGSLCFYLLNRRGQQGRERLIHYIRSYYRSDTRKDNWRDLGFSTPEDLEEAYIEFLKNPTAE